MSTVLDAPLALTPKKVSKKNVATKYADNEIERKQRERRKSPIRVKKYPTDRTLNNQPDNCDSLQEPISPRYRRPRNRHGDFSDIVKPKLCKDQVVSMRKLLEDDIVRLPDDKQLKKKNRKKRVEELQDQIEKRAMLNMQFKSIRTIMIESERLDSSQDNKECERKGTQRITNRNCTNTVGVYGRSPNESGKVAGFDVFGTNAEINREISFRDIMTRKRVGQKSFRDLAKMKVVDVVGYQQAHHQEKNGQMITIDDADENSIISGNDEQTNLDFGMSFSRIWNSGEGSSCRMNYSNSEMSVDSCSRLNILAKWESGSGRVSPIKYSENLRSPRKSKADQVRGKSLLPSIQIEPPKQLRNGNSAIPAKPHQTTRKRNDSTGSYESDINVVSVNSNVSDKREVKRSIPRVSSPRSPLKKEVKDAGLTNKTKIASPVRKTSENVHNKEFLLMENFCGFDFDPQKTPTVNDVQKLHVLAGEYKLKSYSPLPFPSMSPISKAKKTRSQKSEGSSQYARRKSDIKKEKKIDDVLETTNQIFVDY